MKRPPSPPDPEQDWGQDTERRMKMMRLVTLGYFWGIIAMIIGGLMIGAILLGWI